MEQGQTTFCNEIKSLLKSEKGKDIARRLDVTPSIVSQWTSGATLCAEPHLAQLVHHYAEGTSDYKERELARLVLLLWAERLRTEKQAHWQKCPEAKDLAHHVLASAIEQVRAAQASMNGAGAPSRLRGRTLSDFPEAFYPMAVITGDKREESESRITAGDFGAVSASPAECRWLQRLRLRHDVEVFGDKVFVLENVETLKRRFGEKHLLVIGSPGSNHLARRCLLPQPSPGWTHAAPFFRFNPRPNILRHIENLLQDLREFSPKQLVGRSADQQIERELKHSLHGLFTGGILDPTYKDLWIRAEDVPPNYDFGLVSLARNPLAEPGSGFLCVMVAGFHMFGTAHALGMLGQPAGSGEVFDRHPLGGVIKVAIDTRRPFGDRFDDSSAEWDTESEYTIEHMRSGLKEIQAALDQSRHIFVDATEVRECLKLLDEL